MATYRHTNTYAPGGIDYTAPEPLRAPNIARDGENFIVSASGDLIKRPGYALKVKDDVGYGLAVFGKRTQNTGAAAGGWGLFAWGVAAWGSASDTTYGVVTETLVGISDTPKVWTEGSLAIAYTGGGTATVTISATSESDVKLILTVDGSSVLSSDLGDGTESSPVTMTALKTAIDAVADFSATITGTATTPAVALDFRNAKTISSTETIYFGYWTQITSELATPMSNVTARVTETDYELASTATINGCLYISNGFDDMYKYDGQAVYRAGMPTPSSTNLSTAVDTGTGASAGFSGSYKYRIAYKQIDEVLNVVEGYAGPESTAVNNSAGPYAIDLTITNLSNALGYNTRGGYFTSNHSSSNAGTDLETLNVDDGAGGAHNIVAGDRVYFYDTATSAYVALKVDSVTSSTITVESSATLTVTNNSAISCNLRIVIYRTEAGGSLFYKVAEIPNEPDGGTQVYSDTLIDASLGELYSEPVRIPGTPPKGRYSAIWRNQMIVAGDPTTPDVVYYSEFSDRTSPENFPALNQLLISQNEDDRISGLGVVGRNLFIFTDSQIFVVEGNLASHQVRVDLLSDAVGCVAHHTIQSIDGVLYFLSRKGVYRIVPQAAGFRVEHVSQPLDPVFRHNANNDYKDYNLRAQAIVWPEERQYILYLPDETLQSNTPYSTSSSACYVFDIDRSEWYKWTNINAWGGFTMFDDGRIGNVPWWQSSELESSTIRRRMYRMNATKSEIDYADHVAATDMWYQPQWEVGGNPRVYKSYTTLAVDSYIQSSLLPFTPSGDLTVSTYKDFDDSSAELTFTLTPDTVTNNEVLEALPDSQRRSLGLQFRNNTINKQVLVSGWATQSYSYRGEMRR